MRLVSFEIDGRRNYGIVREDRVHEATSAFRASYPDLRSALTERNAAEIEVEPKGRDLADVILLSPIPNPDKIICVGLNYANHIKETGREKPKYPSIFTRYPSSVLGSGVPLLKPACSDEFDYEGELAVIIGKAGRNIRASQAKDYILGYSCFNDGTIRDFQRHTTQFWSGKSFDDTGSMGPWIVTADQLPNPENEHLRTILNGREVQTTPIADLAFSIGEIIEYVSTVTRLLPGDVIATGTPGGVGRFRMPPLYMFEGDRIDVEITGIGMLSNPIAAAN
ncbi:2-keto-4-pentenoate hydratase/2-oxohepta-3-ene-1,7-dioic acid hydratase in catechol pathway [Rhizobium mesoamericanum]|uniref:fumarylacetoacetate hydrolase family protein n=1 Tax=Rhizobium mesoamericanum TaxID=1079800 RepID=UPI002789B0F3|nr:fumarylacetoacetate hydrolase family protein [Rhizobium mesoamericanum]MDQ0559107.1 2-keto-4-pentenoate hydratase/2-oxohepta-3-ene-1,7-dioic acid hydratase in catechol pathway [Rhizobium mesoamericanum]